MIKINQLYEQGGRSQASYEKTYTKGDVVNHSNEAPMTV